MIKYVVKRWIVSQINSLLKKYSDDVDRIRILVNLWIARLNRVLDVLSGLSSRIEDGKIDDDEIQQSIDDVKQIVREW